MRILITGGAGFIGSHLCERFLGQGHEVVCLDNFITGRRENLSPFLSNPSFSLIEHDINTPFFPGQSVDYVLHFASLASPPDYLKHPIPTLKVGSLGTLNALGMAKAVKAKFLLASTSEVYGDPQVHPQPESYWGHVNCVGPRGVYDESKRVAEAMSCAYHREHGVDTRVVRIFNTYGPRMKSNDGRAVPNFIAQALSGEPLTLYGDGTQTRSFCYINDLLEGIDRLMRTDFHDPVNLGNPAEITLLTLAQTILKLTRSKSAVSFKPLPQDDPKRRRPDISLARRLLGWEPGVTLEQGLMKTIEFFRENR